MGRIISKEGKIERLSFKNIRKGRVAKATRVLRTGDSSAIIELEDGTYTLIGPNSFLNGNCAHLNFGSIPPSDAVLHGMVRMGVLTKAQVTRHIKRVKTLDADQSKSGKAYRMIQTAQELGMDVAAVEKLLPKGVTPDRRYRYHQ